MDTVTRFWGLSSGSVSSVIPSDSIHTFRGVDGWSGLFFKNLSVITTGDSMYFMEILKCLYGLSLVPRRSEWGGRVGTCDSTVTEPVRVPPPRSQRFLALRVAF